MVEAPLTEFFKNRVSRTDAFTFEWILSRMESFIHQIRYQQKLNNQPRLEFTGKIIHHNHYDNIYHREGPLLPTLQIF